MAELGFKPDLADPKFCALNYCLVCSSDDTLGPECDGY